MQPLSSLQTVLNCQVFLTIITYRCRSTSPIGRGNFEGEGRPIVKYRDTLRSSVQKRLNRSRCCLGFGFGWKHKIMYYAGSRSPWERAILVGRKACLLQSVRTLCRELCKNGWRDRFAVWVVHSRVDRRKHKFNRIRQVAPMSLDGRKNWCHLVNTIEPPVCGGRAALCQNYFDHLFYYRCKLTVNDQ